MTVVYIRMGDWDGFQWTLEAAKLYAGCRICVVADRDYRAPGVECFPIQDYWGKWAELSQTYKHRHFLPEFHMRRCISRWLVADEFIRRHKIGRHIHLDTDKMIFSPMEEACAPFSECDFTLSAPLGANESAMIINNTDALADFADFVVSQYPTSELTEKWERDGTNVCDMLLWGHFRAQRSYFVDDTSRIIDGTSFDHNLCLAYDGYEFDGETKVVLFQRGQPFIHNAPRNQYIQMHILHCWGLWKNRMEHILQVSQRTKSTGQIEKLSKA